MKEVASGIERTPRCGHLSTICCSSSKFFSVSPPLLRVFVQSNEEATRKTHIWSVGEVDSRVTGTMSFDSMLLLFNSLDED